MGQNRSSRASDNIGNGAEKEKQALTGIDVHIAKAKLILEQFKSSHEVLGVLLQDRENGDRYNDYFIAGDKTNTWYDLFTLLKKENAAVISSHTLRKEKTEHGYAYLIGTKENSTKIMEYSEGDYFVLGTKLYDNLSNSDHKKYFNSLYRYDGSSIPERKFDTILHELQKHVQTDYSKDSLEAFEDERFRHEFQRANMLEKIKPVVGFSESSNDINNIKRRTSEGDLDVSEYMRDALFEDLAEDELLDLEPSNIATLLQDYMYDFTIKSDETLSIDVLDYHAYLGGEIISTAKDIDFKIGTGFSLDYEFGTASPDNVIPGTPENIIKTKNMLDYDNAAYISSLELPKDSIIKLTFTKPHPEKEVLDMETGEYIIKEAHKTHREITLITGDPSDFEKAKEAISEIMKNRKNIDKWKNESL